MKKIGDFIYKEIGYCEYCKVYRFGTYTTSGFKCSYCYKITIYNPYNKETQ